MKPSRKKSRKKKKNSWTVATVLGLAIGAVGALGAIELRPQLSVSPQSEIEKAQPFSAPFRITNAGYLSLYIENVTIYVHNMEYEGFRSQHATSNDPAWDNFTLDRGESKTIVYYVARAPVPPKHADMAIVVDYRFFGITWRRPFRFVGAYVDNWQWLPQPAGDIEAKLNTEVDRGLAIHHRSIANPK
jgi:hypothetical protein